MTPPSRQTSVLYSRAVCPSADQLWSKMSYGGKLCYFTLKAPTDAYEWSFVAVPAQRKAGVMKSFIYEILLFSNQERLILVSAGRRPPGPQLWNGRIYLVQR